MTPKPPPSLIPAPPNFALPEFVFPNFIPGRARLPASFQLWPEVNPLALPVTPPIPPTVNTGDVITAAHENTVSTAISDLWIDVQALEAGKLADPTTAKGDLIARGVSAIARLPVGANGALLTADSGQPSGLRWGALTGYVPVSRQVIAGAGMTGGGALSADVTLNANVTSVFGRTGDVVLGAGDISAAGGVPATRRVNAGAGMSGGGALTADVTLNALVTSVFGRTGDVVLGSADVVAAGGVPATRTLTAGTGLTGGGNLSADRSFAVVDDTTTQRVRVSLGGALQGTRRELNLIQGANVVLTAVDDAVNNRVNVTVNSSGGSGGGSQTPWLSDISAANFMLSTVKAIGIGTAAADTLALAIRKSQATGFPLISAQNTSSAQSAALQLINDTDAWVSLEVGGSAGLTEWRGHGLIKQTNDLIFVNGAITERMRITAAGKVGIGITAPHAALSVIGPLSPPSLTHHTPALASWASAGAVELALHSSDISPYPICLQARSEGADGNAFPLCLNPLGGNVGIGTTTPDSTKRLTVNGWAGATSGFVTASDTGYEWWTGGFSLGIGEYQLVHRKISDSSWTVALSVLPSGSVGIGVASPQATLNVAADATRQLYLTSSSDPVNKQMRIGYDVTNNTCVIEGFVNGAGIPLLLNPSGGNVGIGTTAPSVPLHVKGAPLGDTVSQSFIADLQAFVTSGQDHLLRLSSRRHTAGTDWNGASMRMQHQVQSTPMGYIEFNPGVGAQGIAFGNASTELMRIKSDGNVGIGTASAASRLSVINGGLFVGAAGWDATVAGVGNVHLTGSLVFHNVGGHNIYNADVGGIKFQVWTGSYIADAINITTAGQVCIGTATPSALNHALTVYSPSLRNICAISDGAEAGIMLTNTGSGGRSYSLYSSSGPSSLGQGALSIFDDTASAPRLRITATGLVAIGGYFTPAYNLDVVGDINCTGAFRVNGTPKMVMTASADDEPVASGQTSVWFDEATSRLTVRYRNAAGTLKTAYLPME